MSKSILREAYTSLVTKGRLEPNPYQASLIDRLAILQSHLSTNAVQNFHTLQGLYIYGSVGTGKSRLADLFAATLPASVSKRRIHFHEFMLDIHKRLHTARATSQIGGDLLLHLGKQISAESTVLCVDEFQVSDIADAMILKRLFGAFWAGGGVMVSTSNRHPNKLYENGLNRHLFLPFIEDLKRTSEIWRLQGEEDYRFSPTDERDEIFFTEPTAFEAALAEDTQSKPSYTLSVRTRMNRALQVQAYASHAGKVIVFATYEDLIKRNLGAVDYHALCDAADSIYICGLRQFRDSELDFVRRLVILIDIAYESRTAVKILSDTPLPDLFKNVTPTVEPSLLADLTVRKEGGSSSSNLTTFIGDTEWSATGLQSASLATGGAGEADARFSILRAVSRLSEMSRRDYLLSPISE